MAQPVGIKNDPGGRLPFFFIIGRARSGTTLLRTMLDAHPNVCIPIEAPVILHLSWKYGRRRFWTETDLLEFLDDLLQVRDFQKWGLSREILASHLLAQPANSSFQDLVQQVYLLYPTLFKKEKISLIGDKNPVYSVHIHAISRLYPEARFIHITRDYRDHILSMIRTNLYTSVVMFLAFRWRYSVRQMLRFGDKYPDRVFRLRYEDLVARPEEHLTAICSFLGIAPIPELAHFHVATTQVYHEKLEARLEEHHKKVFSPVATDRVDLFRKEMADADIRIADLVVGKYAEKAGYERVYKGFDLQLFVRLIPGLLYEHFAYFVKNLSEVTPWSARLWLRRNWPSLARRLSNAGK